MSKAYFNSLFLLVIAPSVSAITLPTLPSQLDLSSHRLFIVSQSASAGDFDSWKIDSGYAYTLFDSVDLFVGARIDNQSTSSNENGFLSGVSYHFNERVTLNSTLHTKRESFERGNETSSVAAEVTSRVKITDNLDLHATLDYEQWQQGVELGLGFRF